MIEYKEFKNQINGLGDLVEDIEVVLNNIIVVPVNMFFNISKLFSEYTKEQLYTITKINMILNLMLFGSSFIIEYLPLYYLHPKLPRLMRLLLITISILLYALYFKYKPIKEHIEEYLEDKAMSDIEDDIDNYGISDYSFSNEVNNTIKDEVTKEEIQVNKPTKPNPNISLDTSNMNRDMKVDDNLELDLNLELDFSEFNSELNKLEQNVDLENKPNNTLNQASLFDLTITEEDDTEDIAQPELSALSEALSNVAKPKPMADTTVKITDNVSVDIDKEQNDISSLLDFYLN